MRPQWQIEYESEYNKLRPKVHEVAVATLLVIVVSAALYAGLVYYIGLWYNGHNDTASIVTVGIWWVGFATAVSLGVGVLLRSVLAKWTFLNCVALGFLLPLLTVVFLVVR